MTANKLNPELLAKMAKKTSKHKQYMREQISKRASRSAISSLAAQLLWARDLGLGIASALSRSDPSVRDEVRSATSAPPAFINSRTKHSPIATKQKKHANLRPAIDFLLSDPELHDRCRDLILARRHYDRVVREATTVLDDRLKTVSGISNMNPSALVGKALAPDPAKAVIIISHEKDEQEGFFYTCKGVMQTFRNKAHHTLSNAFTQADALKFCGFIDTILAVIAQGEIHTERS
ncbi:MAG TPA: TIGR02391 family protein [Candidatus Dormibacteraeota bacterium]|nr:TIGR02391 family protein [Candidatus Dormibacteraeota bacterium]